MAALPLRLTPGDDETIVGFLVRLAERNGEDQQLSFFRSLGMPFRLLATAATQRFDLAPLAEASLVPEQRLLAMTYWGRAEGTLEFRGRTVSQAALVVLRRVFCAACLAAGPYHRDAWDLCFSHACPRHGTLLSYRCSACGSRPRWNDRSITRCGCGFDFSSNSATPVPSDDLDGTAEVQALFGIEDAAVGRHHDRWPEALRLLGAERASELMFHLGWYGSGRSGIARLLPNAEISPDVPSILTRGYRIGLGWPASFHEFLALSSGKPSKAGSFGTRKAFGSFLKWVISLPPEEPLARVVWPEIEHFVQTYPALRTRLPHLARATPASDDLITLAEAAHRLHRSIECIGPVLLRYGLMVASDSDGRDAPMLVAAAAVAALAEDLDDLRGKASLRCQLNCSIQILDAILTVGGIVPVDGIVADLSVRPQWRKADARAFLERLNGDTQASSRSPIRFEKAFRLLTQLGCSPQEAAAALIGVIPPLPKNSVAIGLDGVLFEADSVTMHLRQRTTIGDPSV